REPQPGLPEPSDHDPVVLEVPHHPQPVRGSVRGWTRTVVPGAADALLERDAKVLVVLAQPPEPADALGSEHLPGSRRRQRGVEAAVPLDETTALTVVGQSRSAVLPDRLEHVV